MIRFLRRRFSARTAIAPTAFLRHRQLASIEPSHSEGHVLQAAAISAKKSPTANVAMCPESCLRWMESVVQDGRRNSKIDPLQARESSIEILQAFRKVHAIHRERGWAVSPALHRLLFQAMATTQLQGTHHVLQVLQDIHNPHEMDEETMSDLLTVSAPQFDPIDVFLDARAHAGTSHIGLVDA